MASVDTSSTAKLKDTFDYVVIGGGTAGLVVANRLTEDPSISVLVLEAGANRVDDPRIKIPGLVAETLFDPDFDWCITSTPQEHLNGRVLGEPRGRTLGGSSAINLGMVIYPSKRDIDAWEQLGNPGWNWDSLCQYLRKCETFTHARSDIIEELSLQYVDEKMHGTDGPLQVSFGDGPFTYFNEAWPKVFEALNYKLTSDPISGVAKGGFCNAATIDPKTRTRSHAGAAYYNPEVAKRPNLRVITEAMVEKIVLERTDQAVQATGVVFQGKDKVRRTIAAGEVILAAGAMKTPQLLELSGIGDARFLQSHGIEVVIDNPNVGENLQEHGYVPFSWEIADDQQSGEALRNPRLARTARNVWEWYSGSGPLGVCAISSGYLPVPDLQDGELRGLTSQYLDNYQYPSSAGRDAQYRILRQLLEDENEPAGQYTLVPFQITPDKGPSPKGIFGLIEPGNYITIFAVLSRPFSRGSIHLASRDPYQNPVFDPKMLSHPLDVEIQARLVQRLETLAWTEPMASLLKKGGRRLHSNRRVEDLDSARELTRQRMIPHYHVVGTAAMMPREAGGVVDDKLKVYGTTNLRIVDASIFPLLPRGNIQISVFAVAEKAADIIKGERKRST